MIQIYDSRIDENQKIGIDASIVAGLFALSGITPELYGCLCKYNYSLLRLEGMVLLDPCDEEEEQTPANQYCWESVRQVIQSNPNIPFYINAIIKGYREESIGQFPNVKYIGDINCNEIIDEMIKQTEKR